MRRDDVSGASAWSRTSVRNPRKQDRRRAAWLKGRGRRDGRIELEHEPTGHAGGAPIRGRGVISSRPSCRISRACWRTCPGCLPRAASTSRAWRSVRPRTRISRGSPWSSGRRPAPRAGAQAAREDRHGRQGARHLARGLRRARLDADQGQGPARASTRDQGPGSDLPRPDRGRQPRPAHDRDLRPGAEDRGFHRARSAPTKSWSSLGRDESPWYGAIGRKETRRRREPRPWPNKPSRGCRDIPSSNGTGRFGRNASGREVTHKMLKRWLWTGSVTLLAISFAVYVVYAAWTFNDQSARRFGIIGSGASILAIAYTAYQVYQTEQLARAAKNASEAAKEAAERATTELRTNHYRYCLLDARRLMAEARLYAEVRQWRLASLRADDLASQASQLANARPEPDEQWIEARGRLRGWALSFRAAQTKKPLGRPVDDWNELCGVLPDKIDQECSPLGVIEGE